MHKLTFGKGNAKLDKRTYTFSLPAGHSCPGALECLAKADPDTGKITDGTSQTYRCFAASAEMYPSVRNSRWNNFNLLRSAKTTDAMTGLILASIPNKTTRIRLHVSGDFFSPAYLAAWIAVAHARPTVTFYAYTKSVHLLPERAKLPDNLRITVSDGTRYGTDRARKLGYSIAWVVLDTKSALPIDHDDTHAAAADHDFALLIHGGQKAGSAAGRAFALLKKAGWGGYTRDHNGKGRRD